MISQITFGPWFEVMKNMPFLKAPMGVTHVSRSSRPYLFIFKGDIAWKTDFFCFGLLEKKDKMFSVQ